MTKDNNSSVDYLDLAGWDSRRKDFNSSSNAYVGRKLWRTMNSMNLDSALDSLDMLSTVTNARKEYLNEMRIRGVRPFGCGTSSSPSTSASSSSAYSSRRTELCSSYGGRRKENMSSEGHERTVLFCASNSGSTKLYFRRQKFRPSPYDISLQKQRRPLNTLLNPMLAHPRVRTSDSCSESVHLGEDSPFHLVHDDELTSSSSNKTDKKFPVPLLLARSRSLEDLSKTGMNKTVRFLASSSQCSDDNSNGTASSSGSGSVESPLSVSPRTSFFNVLRGEAHIKSEIESMSMLIEKLDVA